MRARLSTKATGEAGVASWEQGNGQAVCMKYLRASDRHLISIAFQRELRADRASGRCNSTVSMIFKSGP
jgi:hypothetical protein